MSRGRPAPTRSAAQRRPVLITGCSSGIGLASARQLRERGYHVLATARSAGDVDRLRRQNYDAIRLDLADSTSIGDAVAMVLERTNGELYGLFNNGAYGQAGAVEDLTRAALREQFETNLFGWHELTCQLVPVMRRQGYGRIIQNGSILGRVALKFRGAYCASKFALEGLTDTLRLELVASGIHVSLIEPGPIETRFRSNTLAALRRHVDTQGSVHRAAYTAMQARLRQEGAAVPFTLPPQAVVRRVIHALESPRPKVRYTVTVPAQLLVTLQRLLPHRLLDRLLLRLS